MRDQDGGGDGGDSPGDDPKPRKGRIQGPVPRIGEAPSEKPPDDPGGDDKEDHESKGHDDVPGGEDDDDMPPGPTGWARSRASEKTPDSILKHLSCGSGEPATSGHWSKGMPSDGKIYINDDGEPCKIDKSGKPYKVGRRLIPTKRPVDKYAPEEWAKLGSEGRARAIAKEKKEAKKLEKKMKKAAKEIVKEEKENGGKGDAASGLALPRS